MKYLKKYENWQNMVGSALKTPLDKHLDLYDKDPKTVQ